jgi:hypothetical protein
VDSLAQGSQSGAAERQPQAIEDPTSPRLGVTFSAWSNPPTSVISPPDSESPRDQQTGEIASDVRTAELEHGEQTEAHFERGETDWTARASSVAVARTPNPEVSPADTSRTGSAPKVGPVLAVIAANEVPAIERSGQVVDTSPSQSRIEQWWRAVRTIAERWLRAIKAFVMETNP